MDIDGKISESINSAVNKIIARFLCAVFVVTAVVFLLTCTGVFATTLQQTLLLMLASAPGGLCGLLILRYEPARVDHRSKYLICTLMCIQAIAVAFAAYSYVGTLILLLPILLASLYPKTRTGAVVSAAMIVCGIVIPPLALLMGFWDGPYNEFLYDLSFGRPMDTATLSSELLSLPDQIICALQYCSTQNVLIIGGFAAIARLVYRQSNKSYDSQREVAWLSETDELTGLLNRRSFMRRLANFSTAPAGTACIYLDVNGLHEMNNTLGHQAGDVMLQFVGSQIQNAFGEDNAYRIGGDEYTALTKEVSSESLAQEKAALEQAFADAGYCVAIGYALSDGDIDPDGLVRQAEKAMYQAKNAYYLEHDRRASETRESRQSAEDREGDQPKGDQL